jgi:EAL domain-containing protein (putative c-di-GMP-specific phosphodiesterase class I)
LVAVYQESAVQHERLREQAYELALFIYGGTMAIQRSEPRHWSGPIESLDEIERHALLDRRSARPRPRIDIDEALDNGWFEIWYQPKIDLKRKCLAGAEALARIRHPRCGMLPPGSFLPGVAEGSVSRLAEHALVAVLGSWTLFDQAAFNLQLAMNMPVSVMVSLPIRALVDKHRPRSDRWPGIILEMCEDQIVRDMKLAQEIAEQLGGSGIKIAIDDFGAGYSLPSSLRELPFTELKLAESFVKNCAADATNAAICQTAIDMAHRFGSAAVAKGIETAADLQALMVRLRSRPGRLDRAAHAPGALSRPVAEARERLTRCRMSDVRCQINTCPLSSVICHLFSVICSPRTAAARQRAATCERH